MPGKRMSEREYMDRVSRLMEKVRAESAATENKASLFEKYRDAEFDLTVEYRLGPDFPVERREALRAADRRVQRQLEERRKEYASGRLSQQELQARMQAMADEMARAYASVLTPEEMTAFFGRDKGADKLPFPPEEPE